MEQIPAGGFYNKLLKFDGCKPKHKSPEMRLTAEGQRLLMGEEQAVFTREGD